MDNTQLTFDEFQSFASTYKTVPVYKRILADLLTPVAAWVHLSQKIKYAFLLESAEKGNHYTRYLYVEINPQKILLHKNGKTTISENDQCTNVDILFLDLFCDYQSQYNF